MNSINLSQLYIAIEGIIALELEGINLLVSGNSKKGIKILEKAISFQTDLITGDPPFYIRPTAELLADILIKKKEYKKAEKLLKELLIIQPYGGHTLYRLAKVSIGLGDFKQAQQYSELRQINGKRNYEATKLHASSNRMGNAYRIPRSA